MTAIFAIRLSRAVIIDGRIADHIGPFASIAQAEIWFHKSGLEIDGTVISIDMPKLPNGSDLCACSEINH